MRFFISLCTIFMSYGALATEIPALESSQHYPKISELLALSSTPLSPQNIRCAGANAAATTTVADVIAPLLDSYLRFKNEHMNLSYSCRPIGSPILNCELQLSECSATKNGDCTIKSLTFDTAANGTINPASFACENLPK